MSYLQAVIIAIVQGITEFLPISSTGHMIIAESILGIKQDGPYGFTSIYGIGIHFGSILAVIILYWRRFFQSLTFYYKLFIAFIPVAIIGLLLEKQIDSSFRTIVVIAISLIAGGIVFLFIDKWFSNTDDKKEVTYSSALKIGLFQVISLFPGISRSGATIIGGMTQKLTRKMAAEFSFLLAVPTILAASGYKIFKAIHSFHSGYTNKLIIGNAISFVISIIVIRAFIGYIQKHGFKLFGYYRIALGLIILILLAFHIPLQIDLD
jgi:undecaprenyl-diphosphatase